MRTRLALGPLFLFLLGTVFLFGTGATAQLGQGGRPASALQPQLLPSDAPTYVMPQPDVERLMREDEERNNWPGRYGAVIPSGLSSDDAGRWDDVPSGELVWRLRIVSPGAHSLGLLFDRYELPASGKLFVHGAHGTLLGAFTQATRQANGMLAVQPVRGDELLLEYVQDASDSGQPVLRIGEVIHDYRGILEMMLESPVALSGGGCLVDVNCPIGAPYRDIQRGVMFVLMGGGYCSAGLLNNTAEDGTPYFLTANHCGDMTNVVAVFDYENAGCSMGPSSQSKSISGATLLAASTRFDSQLYRLSSAPPASFEPFYAGWDRNLNQTGLTISISHPGGAPKKIARDNDAPLVNGWRYQVTWEVGKLTPGSSGSPLFNSSKRVIGPACCVSDFGCGGQWAMYGRFGGFWAQRDLDQWLDPLGADPTSFGGFDPFQGRATVYNGGGGNPLLYSSTTPPTLGTTWNAAVDTASYPGVTSTWVFGYLAPSSGTFWPYGELLVDINSPKAFKSIAPAAGGISLHANALPNLPALIGVELFTQGLLLGGPILLTNGIELELR